MNKEKNFQNYFLKNVGHCQRCATSPGEPDTAIIRGLSTYRVELKILEVGVSGNKKIKGLFKPTQPPWYLKFLLQGGKGLFVCFRLNKGYGLLEVTQEFCKGIDNYYYKDLLDSPYYTEYKVLKDMVKANFR